MALAHTPICEYGKPAPDFRLKGIDENFRTLHDCTGEKGVLVMFISNHCPYVKAIRKKLVRDCTDLQALGVGCVAIMPNDTVNYPEDSLPTMKQVAEKFEFPFPYLIDETQQVARAYGAVCTPDFFGYNANLELQYRGRLDGAGANPDAGDEPRELYQAMKQVAETGRGPEKQLASMGCSIKWKS
ncbi:MAG: thioredoxin family protein [Xanthomonadales bacterium]|nr:thioredoxin family protein [Xanthomonadales bacterium]